LDSSANDANVVTAFRAIVEYDGTNYAGWQIQLDVPTVQRTLEIALTSISQQEVRVTGAGRTDAGVHASGQVIGFDVVWRHSIQDLERAWNAVLPNDIAVRCVELASPGFHPRFSARSRTYCYTVWSSPVRAPLRMRYALHVHQALNLDAMNEAASYLLGWHDFATFGTAPELRSGSSGTKRHVIQAHWTAIVCNEGTQYVFTIEANAFLRSMVRTLVAGLLEVGVNRITVGDFHELLTSAKRQRGPAPAPACGLCLINVRY